MASAKLVKALAEQNVRLRKGPRVSGEVVLSFRGVMNRQTGTMEKPSDIRIVDWREVNPMARVGVTIEQLRNSNLADLVRRQAVVLI